MQQERLALRLISEMMSLWKEADIPVWSYPYKVFITSKNSALVETVLDSLSIHSIKKRMSQNGKLTCTLLEYFIDVFYHFIKDIWRNRFKRV